MLSYNEGYVRLLNNDLNVFDIRRIPYMQQYTQQPYVYNVIGHGQLQGVIGRGRTLVGGVRENLWD